jgi:hypothetical protein
MPDVIPVQSRFDASVGDSGTLEQMGRIGLQPVPSPRPEPGSRPDPADEAEKAALTAALGEAGVTATAGDHAAVQALAVLDPATVEAVTRWLKTKKDKPETPGGK